MSNKKIEFEYKDTKYTLEFTRHTVAIMEDNGFNISKFTTQPASMIEKAFQGAFLKNHPRIALNVIDEIYNKFSNKDKLIAALADMLTEVYDGLTQTDEAKDGKNLDWKIV